MGGLQAKSMTSQRYHAVTRWWICVTMATLWQQQDGGYALLWKRYDNNDVSIFRLMGGLQAKSMTSQRNRAVTRWRICFTMATLWQQQDGGYALLFYIFNSTVIDWTCFICYFVYLHSCLTYCLPQLRKMWVFMLCYWQALNLILPFGCVLLYYMALLL